MLMLKNMYQLNVFSRKDKRHLLATNTDYYGGY